MPSPFELGARIGGNVSGGIQAGLEKRRDYRAMDEILQASKQIQNPNDYQGLIEQAMQTVSEARRPELMNLLQQREQLARRNQSDQAIHRILGMDVSGMSDKQKEIMLSHSLDTQRALAIQQIKNQGLQGKNQLKEQEKKDLAISMKNNLDKLRELTPYAGSERVGNWLAVLGMKGGEAGTFGRMRRNSVEKRAYMNKLGFWITDQLYTHFNKGVMNIPKLEQVKKELAPNSENSEREYKARVDALEAIASLPPDIDSKTLDKYVDKKIEEVKNNVEQGNLDEEMEGFLE